MSRSLFLREELTDFTQAFVDRQFTALAISRNDFREARVRGNELHSTGQICPAVLISPALRLLPAHSITILVPP